MFSEDVITSMTSISAPHVLKKLTFGKAVSQIYQDYMEPLIMEWLPDREKLGYEHLNKLCEVPWSVWNAIVFKDYYPLAEKGVLYNEMLEKIEDPKMKAVIDFWVIRKRTSFGKYRFLFGDCLFFTLEGQSRCRADIRLTKSIIEIYGQYGESE